MTELDSALRRIAKLEAALVPFAREAEMNPPHELEQIARHARYHARQQCASEAEAMANDLILPHGQPDRRGRAALRRIASLFKFYAKQEIKEIPDPGASRMSEENLLRAIAAMAAREEATE